jgi:outer membrane receptor for ferrienterochelin and colicin
VVPDTNFKQTTSQITGLLLSNPDLKPETGEVKTFGVVYEPQFLSGLSVELDYWDYHIDGLITTLDAKYASDQCVATGTTFCDLMHRYPSGPNAGKILVFELPTLNLGQLDTDGMDIGLKYVLRDTSVGGFQFSIDATHINNYTSTLGDQKQEVAGTYDRQFGNYAKWRAVAQVGWNYQDFAALISARYIDSIVLHNPSGSGVTEDLVTPYPDLQIPSATYIDLSVAYTIAKTNTRFSFGIRNAGDKQPPILYQNNVTNANTDVQTYDTIGRQYFAQFGQKF